MSFYLEDNCLISTGVLRCNTGARPLSIDFHPYGIPLTLQWGHCFVKVEARGSIFVLKIPVRISVTFVTSLNSVGTTVIVAFQEYKMRFRLVMLIQAVAITSMSSNALAGLKDLVRVGP
jgi:hypothetical protein